MSAYQCHEFFTEALKFTRPHAVDAEHLAGGEWRLFRHLDQRRVVEDHVWRDILFVGDRFTQFAQLGKQLAVVIAAKGFLHRLRLQRHDTR